MGRRILVVDDDEGVREIASLALAELGTVAVCPDAYQALDRMRTERVDVVVLDLMMPGLSGADLMERMERDGMARPTVVVTGMVSGPLLGRVTGLGAIVVSKPFRPDQLRAAVEQAMLRLESPEPEAGG